MVVSLEDKKNIVKKYGANSEDTGRTEVQIAILTAEIKELTEHLKVNKKDNHSKLGLFKKVSKRNSLLKYLKGENFNRYSEIVKALKLRA